MQYIKLKNQDKIAAKDTSLLAEANIYNPTNNAFIDMLIFRLTDLTFEEAKEIITKDNITVIELYENDNLIKTFEGFTSVQRIIKSFESNIGIEVTLQKPNV